MDKEKLTVRKAGGPSNRATACAKAWGLQGTWHLRLAQNECVSGRVGDGHRE